MNSDSVVSSDLCPLALFVVVLNCLVIKLVFSFLPGLFLVLYQ